MELGGELVDLGQIGQETLARAAFGALPTRHDVGHRASVDREHDALAALDRCDDAPRVVSKLANRDVHVAQRSTKRVVAGKTACSQ